MAKASKQSKEIVKVVMDELSGRGGFDGWWNNIDDTIQKEIKQTLAEIVEEKL